MLGSVLRQKLLWAEVAASAIREPVGPEPVRPEAHAPGPEAARAGGRFGAAVHQAQRREQQRHPRPGEVVGLRRSRPRRSRRRAERGICFRPARASDWAAARPPSARGRVPEASPSGLVPVARDKSSDEVIDPLLALRLSEPASTRFRRATPTPAARFRIIRAARCSARTNWLASSASPGHPSAKRSYSSRPRS